MAFFLTHLTVQHDEAEDTRSQGLESLRMLRVKDRLEINDAVME